jgi:phosphopantetheine adenylyltransferase
MEFHVRSLSTPERIGILPGSFNPPTLAHCALVHAAGFYVDEVLCVLPRAFPHKEYFGATLKERLQMLDQSDLFPIYSSAISQVGCLSTSLANAASIMAGQRNVFYLRRRCG